jgi:hypothetical protein
LPNPATGEEVPADQLQAASLSALGDMFAVVVRMNQTFRLRQQMSCQASR